MVDKHSVADYLEYKGAKIPQRAGGWRKMRCPFHDDGHASAAVNFDANVFKCHACGVAGDVYDLIRHDKGGTFSEAVEFAQTISTTGDTTVRIADRTGSRLSRNTKVVGRRGSHVSLGSGRRSSSGT
jgi:hypothetical protein